MMSSEDTLTCSDKILIANKYCNYLIHCFQYTVYFFFDAVRCDKVYNFKLANNILYYDSNKYDDKPMLMRFIQKYCLVASV